LPLYFAVLLLALLGHEIFLRDARFFPQLFAQFSELWSYFLLLQNNRYAMAGPNPDDWRSCFTFCRLDAMATGF
jgi:hypothetical protein